MQETTGAGQSHASILGADVVRDPAVEIGAGVVITGRVTLLGSTRVGPGVVIEGPRIGAPLTVGPDAVVGAGAVISMASIGARAVLEAGAVVARPVPANAVIGGNPGRLIRTRPGRAAEAVQPSVPTHQGQPRDALISLRLADDMRGALVAGEAPGQLPFQVSRFFTVFDVPGPEVRGEHAHYECHQLLVAVAGSLEVICDDGNQSRTYTLSRPDVALHIPPLVWGVQHQYSSDAVLLVLASHGYDPADYIRDYDEFRRIVRERAAEQSTRIGS